MILLPKSIRQQLPKLYANEKLGLQAPALVKFFSILSHWTWYASEFDGKDIFFGYVIGDFPELGYFSLSELESVKGPLGLLIERDRYFKPTPLEGIINHYKEKAYAL